jgi:hypothetical protein
MNRRPLGEEPSFGCRRVVNGSYLFFNHSSLPDAWPAQRPSEFIFEQPE